LRVWGFGFEPYTTAVDKDLRACLEVEGLGFGVQAVCCSALQCAAVCCSVLQCVEVCCSVLQCVAVCCSVLQYVAVWCSVL